MQAALETSKQLEKRGDATLDDLCCVGSRTVQSPCPRRPTEPSTDGVGCGLRLRAAGAMLASLYPFAGKEGLEDGSPQAVIGLAL